MRPLSLLRPCQLPHPAGQQIRLIVSPPPFALRVEGRPGDQIHPPRPAVLKALGHELAEQPGAAPSAEHSDEPAAS